MRNFRCEWTNEQCFDRWFYGFPQEQHRDHKQTGCGLSESGNWASGLGPASLWPYWGERSQICRPLKWHSSEWQSTELCFVFVFFKQPHQQTHIDFPHTAGTWLCCIIISSLFQTVTLCHCINIQPIFFVRNCFCVPNWGQLKTHRNPSYIYIDSFDGKVLY